MEALLDELDNQVSHSKAAVQSKQNGRATHITVNNEPNGGAPKVGGGPPLGGARTGMWSKIFSWLEFFNFTLLIYIASYILLSKY